MIATLPSARLVLVDDPDRLTRDALVAAVDAVPGLSAIDGSTADRTAVARADAVVVAASSLRFGWHRLLVDGTWEDGPSPVVVVADNGPVDPAVDDRGVIVVSRQTPLSELVDCLLVTGGRRRQALGRWRRGSPRPGGGPPLTSRERQVLSLLASGLSPAEVSRTLAITIHTTRDHIKAIREKFDRPTTMAAVLEAIRRGVVHVETA